MRPVLALTLNSGLLASAMPLSAQPTFSGTPTGTVHQSSRQTQSDPTTTNRQKKRLTQLQAKVKSADAEAARRTSRSNARPRS